MTVESLARDLAAIGLHAADMQSRNEDRHEACLWCETAVLLSRVVSFGKQERELALQSFGERKREDT